MTPADKLKDCPDYKCKAHCEMAPAIKIMRDVFGGTAKMRCEGKTYLPQEPAESDSRYQSRLSRSVFFNATRKTRDALVGMVLKKNPVPGEGVPESIKPLLENMDLCGNHLDVFVKELFTDAVGEGHAFVLVDMQGALPENATYEDEKKSGRRPYCVKYKGDQASNWRFEQINGEYALTQVSLEECSTEPDGMYGEKEVVKARIFRLPVLDYGLDDSGNQVRPAVFGTVEWELQRKVKNQTTGEDEWVTEGSGIARTRRIPLAPVYGRKKREFCSEPPLIDQAYLNIKHYQESSDLANILHVANVPILVRKGAPPEEVAKGLTVGSNAAVDVGENGDLKYAEHEGKAIESARKSIMDDEQRMSAIGLSLIAAKSDREVTLGEKQMDQDERMSELATMARSLKDCIEMVLAYMAQYLGVADVNGYGGKIEISLDDAAFSSLDAQTLTALYQMYLNGDLTLDTLFKIMAGSWKAVDLENEPERVQAQRLINVRGATLNAPPVIRALMSARSGNGQQMKMPENPNPGMVQ